VSTDLASVSTETARELLVDLVGTDSPSGEESAVAARLVEFFERHDREVWLDAVGNVRAPADDGVLLTSHLDTVPGDVPVRIEDDPTDAVLAAADREAGHTEVLWGRGSVDATGPLVAMAVAAVRTGSSFVGVVGEETESRGARHLLADRDAPAALLNGEPSGATGITLGYRGFCSGTYTARTDAGHSSRPEPNAIEEALSWWQRFEARLADRSEDDAESTAVFEQVTAKPVAVDGGPTDDGLVVDATLEYQLRIPPSTTATALQECAESALEDGSLSWAAPIPPVMVSPRTPVARALRASIRETVGEPRLVRKTGTSDMNVYASAWDCPMATYGPGDSTLDHAPDERLSLAAFDRSIDVLESTANRLLAADSA
jgi:LysW-gamma-L-lysine carboxypeptidase